jgi:predicted dehydrogenase
MDDIELTALATGRAETARAVERKYKVPCHVGWQGLVADTNVDAVIASVSTPVSPEVGCAALENGKHCFVETQGIITPELGQRFRRLEKETGLVVQFGYMRAYAPIYIKMKSVLEEWRKRDPGPRLWLMRYYYGDHLAIHILVHLAGPIKTVQGVGTERGRVLLYEFANGDVGSIAFTHPLDLWANTERIEVSSPTGVLAAHNFYELRYLGDLTETYGYSVRFDSASETVWNPAFSIPYFSLSSQYLHGTQPALEAFVDYIRGGGRPRANVDTVEHTMYVKSAGLESLATGKRIVIEQYIAAHRPA